MSELSFEDLLVLSKANIPQQALVMTSILEESSLPKLVKAGLATDQGKLTKKGIAASEKVKEKFKLMYDGIPLEKRVRNEADEAKRHDVSDHGWFVGTVKQKPYFTNYEILLIGRPDKSMRAMEASSKVKQSVSNTVLSHSSGKRSEFVELYPELFILDPVSDIRCVKLVSRDGKTKAYIQAMYYDLVKERYPSATFHVNTKRAEKFVPVQVRVTNRGWKNNTVGLIMVVNYSGDANS